MGMTDEDVTIDKGMQCPLWEGNEALLTCHDETGKLTICVWKAPSHASLGDFQGKKELFFIHISCADWLHP